MFDTVNMWLDKGDISNIHLLDIIPQNLTEVTHHGFDNRSGLEYINGTLRNYKVSISTKGVSLKGSLAKFYLGNNLEELDLDNTKMAIQQLSDIIKIPIEKAKINRLDLGLNFITKYPAETYFNYLGSSRYFKRLEQPKSIYYTNKLRKLIFYNKITEAKKNGTIIPQAHRQSNILRYELRFMKSVSKQLKENVTAEKLFDNKFYHMTKKKMVSYYESIQKVKTYYPNLENIKSPKDFVKILTLIGLSKININQALKEVEILRKIDAFKKPEYYSRLKRTLKNLANSEAYTNHSEHIMELDSKINSIK